jgi:hypothetical protein
MQSLFFRLPFRAIKSIRWTPLPGRMGAVRTKTPLFPAATGSEAFSRKVGTAWFDRQGQRTF